MGSGLVSTAALLLSASTAFAQGVATAGIRGSIRADSSQNIEGARVRVIQTTTGFSTEVQARRGHFVIEGLDPGGPYTITVRSVGFIPAERVNVFLQLGELRELEFLLKPAIAQLAPAITVGAKASLASATVSGGVGTTISDLTLHRLPTLNRDLYDFVPLSPQISTKVSLPNPGFSAAGASFRFNNFLINGASERTLSGGVSTAFAGAKSLPLDAVQEYVILVAPYDARYGDFAGALVNTVTRFGTNTVQASAFTYGRNEQLARQSGPYSVSTYDRLQSGLSVGGPIVPDRLHLFIAAEFQRYAFPALGPYVGQPQTASRPVPVSAANLFRLDTLMRSYGLATGSSGPVQNGNPLQNVFARLDLSLPSINSRAEVWTNYSDNDNIAFSRASPDTFSLSTYQVTNVSKSHLTALQLHTTLPRAGGGQNEMLFYVRSESQNPVVDVQQPIVRISVPGINGTPITLNTGTHETAQGTRFRSATTGLKDDLSLSLGSSHVLTVGVGAEGFRLRREGVLNSYGTWSFASLDNFELGIADRYEVGTTSSGASAPLDGGQYAGYVSDQWQASTRLSITGGIRADLLAIDGHAPYNAAVDSIFGRRTDQMPRRRVELAPRVGFVWDVSGDQRHFLRGGAGIFAGRFPLGWVQTALSSYGAGTGLLRCGSSTTDIGPAPAFDPSHLSPPQQCANSAGVVSTQTGDIDLLDRNLRMARMARASVTYEAELPGRMLLTAEGVLSRGISDFVFQNLNLRATGSADRNGRVMYGSIAPSGVATSSLVSKGFSEVIDLRNGRSRSYDLSARLEKNVSDRVTGSVSYTHSGARDAQTPLRVNTRGTAAWAGARTLSGRDDDLSLGVSSNDVPNRVVLTGTYATTRPRWRTAFALYYVGESGRPFAYIASGASRRGDLNADGSNSNDPIYVPRDAFDTSEIRFAGTPQTIQIQQAGFEQLIKTSDCLRRQRGHILARNSCREPWSNTTSATVRQSVPLSGHHLEFQLDALNVLNLLNDRWGLRHAAIPVLLNQVGQTPGTIDQSHSIFRFDTSAPRWTAVPAESSFQLQLGLRYTL